MGVLRAEIRRLARKETRQIVRTLKRQVTFLRRRVREYRGRIEDLERRLRQAASVGPRERIRGEAPETQIRFSAAWVRAHRKKLRMSRRVYAALIGVSPQTIVGWEAGRTRPRRAALEAWRAIREKGLRELKAMAAASEKGKVVGRAGGRKRRARRRAKRGARGPARRRVRRVARARRLRRTRKRK
jgi:DNA-binding transcriptional regulator YiaG